MLPTVPPPPPKAEPKAEPKVVSKSLFASLPNHEAKAEYLRQAKDINSLKNINALGVEPAVSKEKHLTFDGTFPVRPKRHGPSAETLARWKADLAKSRPPAATTQGEQYTDNDDGNSCDNDKKHYHYYY